MSAIQYVLMKNLSRSVTARTKRASAPGSHKIGFVMDDGTRVRCAGKRYTQIDWEDFLDNSARILHAAEHGFIEILSPEERPIELDDLRKMIDGSGHVPHPVDEKAAQEVIEALPPEEEVAAAPEPEKPVEPFPEPVTEPAIPAAMPPPENAPEPAAEAPVVPADLPAEKPKKRGRKPAEAKAE